jgi:hypothetical protein
LFGRLVLFLVGIADVPSVFMSDAELDDWGRALAGGGGAVLRGHHPHGRGHPAVASASAGAA